MLTPLRGVATPAPEGALVRLARQSRRYRRKRSVQRFFLCLTRFATPGGVAILTIAFLSRILWPPLVWTLALLPAWLAAVAGYVLRREDLWRVPAWQSDALADVRSGSRGMFMALEEADGKGWPERLGRSDLRLPVPFPWPQGMGWFAAGVLAVAVLLLPDLRPKPAQAIPATTPLDRMEDMVATLREEDLADEEYLDRVDEVLKELREQKTQSLRAADWQALDGFREDLKRQTAESYRQYQEGQREFSAFRSALSKPAAPDELKKIAKELGKMGREGASALSALAAAECGLNSEQLQEFLEKCRAGDLDFNAEELALLKALARQFQLNPEDMRRLAELMGQMDLSALAGFCDKMRPGSLSEAELAELLAKCKGGECSFTEEELEQLRAMLLAAIGECEGKYAACATLLDGLPGRGGVNRGPGPAPLMHTGDTGTGFGQFKGKGFRGNMARPEVPLGFAFAPPDDVTMPEDAAGDGPGESIQFGAGDERITWHSRLLPRHSDVMKNYFREQNNKEP